MLCLQEKKALDKNCSKKTKEGTKMIHQIIKAEDVGDQTGIESLFSLNEEETPDSVGAIQVIDSDKGSSPDEVFSVQEINEI